MSQSGRRNAWKVGRKVGRKVVISLVVLIVLLAAAAGIGAL